MAFQVKLKYLRISPRKARLVADLVRGKKIAEAQAILGFTVKKGSEPILKLLNSAVANAKNSGRKENTDLFISKIVVDEGPTAKRVLPRAKGRADRIMKRSSHITLVLDEKRGPKKAKKNVAEKKKEEAKPAKTAAKREKSKKEVK